MVMRSKKNWI